MSTINQRQQETSNNSSITCTDAGSMAAALWVAVAMEHVMASGKL